MKDYEAYFESKDDIKIGEEMELEISDRDTFEEINVKAIISDKKEDFDPEECDNLWVEFGGHLGINREQWYIKIIEKKEEKIEEVGVRKKVKSSLGQRRGFMIKSMIEEREVNKKGSNNRGKKGDNS
jgi:hypothetical protein